MTCWDQRWSKLTIYNAPPSQWFTMPWETKIPDKISMFSSQYSRTTRKPSSLCRIYCIVVVLTGKVLTRTIICQTREITQVSDFRKGFFLYSLNRQKISWDHYLWHFIAVNINYLTSGGGGWADASHNIFPIQSPSFKIIKIFLPYLKAPGSSLHHFRLSFHFL